MNEITTIDRYHSRLIRLDRRADSQNFRDAASDLLGQLEATEVNRKRKRRGLERERLSETIEAMVADLYVTRCDDPELCLGYSRSKSYYHNLPRYRPSSASYTTVTLVVRFLVSSGYAENLPGFYQRDPDKSITFGNKGIRSRLRATLKLEGFLWETHGVLPKHIKTAREGELLRLKDVEGNLIDYADTSATREMRKKLEEANALLADTQIEAPRYDGIVNPDLTNKSLYRIFNGGRFDRGGRFYGAWWVNAKKKLREQITINGEPTVELDYSAYHLRLCYHLSGVTPPDREDLYAIEGAEDIRPAVKWAVAVLLNTEQGKRMARPKKDKIKEMLTGDWDTAKLRRLVEGHYADIGAWFGAGRGTELQYIDSQIAETVLGRLTSEGIACLPVHDSFIVDRHHQSLLHDTMMEAYTDKLLKETGLTLYPVIT